VIEDLNSLRRRASDFWKRKRTDCEVKGGCKEFLK